MPLLILLIAFLFIVEIFWLIQLTEAGINFIGADGGGFFSTGNPLAWIVVFVLMAIAAGLIRWIFRLLNALAALALAGLFSLGSSRGITGGAAVLSSVLIWVFWLAASAGLTGLTLGYFAEHRELNGFLADGNGLATVLTYFAILGLVFPSGDDD